MVDLFKCSVGNKTLDSISTAQWWICLVMSSNDSRKITQSPLATGAGSTPLAHAENKPSINLIIMLKISNQTCSSMKSNVLSNYKKNSYVYSNSISGSQIHCLLCSLLCLGINPDKIQCHLYPACVLNLISIIMHAFLLERQSC